MKFDTLKPCRTLHLIFALGILFLTVADLRAQLPRSGGGEVKFPENACLTEDMRAGIHKKLRESMDSLAVTGRLQEISSFLPPMFSWPVRGNNGALNDYGVHGISNFVDQNPGFPNQLLDYNCGARTYDTAAGYNHGGIDIFTWPFWWNKMDANEVVAIAAAPGQIIFKSNGNFDRSCASNGNNWNAVYLRHSDGTVAWYGHLKNNSLTSKAVGDTVIAGEYLGVVGSSGNSTGPHLHYEIYNASNQLQDPYQGTCNSMNATTYWNSQPAYRDSRINKLMTHSAPPSFQTCPNPDIINSKDRFMPGENLTTVAYYRDQTVGQVSQMSIIRPDGANFQTWSHTSPNTYAASYWFWNWTIPANAPSGVWKYRVVYQSETFEQTFRVGSGSTDFDFDGDGKSDVGVFRPSDNVWYLNNSRAGFSAIPFGSAGDKIVPADYDGDGKTDIAIFRNGEWYLLRSQLGYTGVFFGSPGDIPQPADYDGDGRADPAVFRPSDGTWYFLRSRDGFGAVAFGSAGDKPVIGDYDGDDKADPTVFRDGFWYQLLSAAGYTGVHFGLASDKPLTADFDGDGKSDIAVYRDGSWYQLRTTQGYTGVHFGIASDKTTAADFDGDGKADVAVYRDGAWYILGSQSGYTGVNFGLPADLPVENAYNY